MSRAAAPRWDHLTDELHTGRGGEVQWYTRRLRCERCGVERQQDISIASRTLAILSTRYRYPTDYRLTAETTAVEIAREYISRTAGAKL